MDTILPLCRYDRNNVSIFEDNITRKSTKIGEYKSKKVYIGTVRYTVSQVKYSPV